MESRGFIPYARPVFVGREPELSLADELIAGAAAGSGGALLLEGEPGFGRQGYQT